MQNIRFNEDLNLCNRLESQAKQKSAPNVEHFGILNQVVVRSIDLSWNTIEASILLIYEKLANIRDYVRLHQAVNSDPLPIDRSYITLDRKDPKALEFQ